MFVHKLWFLAMLATIAALATVGKPSPLITECNLAKPNMLSAQRAKALPAVFLPVQTKNPKDLGPGKLLVASRGLRDPHFTQTVVLLFHYDDQAVIGLVLNRRSQVPLSRALQGLKAAKDRSDPVYIGGPVQFPGVLALLRSTAKIEGSEEIFDGVHLISAKTPLFEQTISARPDPSVFHVYLGCAVWTIDQLRKEVELGGWFIFPTDANTVFSADPDLVWSRMIQKTELKLAGSEPSDLDPGRRAGQFRELRYKD